AGFVPTAQYRSPPPSSDSYTLRSYCVRSTPSKSRTTWHSPTSAATSVMCSVKATRFQSIGTSASLLRVFPARHAHLPCEAREQAGALRRQRRIHLDRTRALAESAGDV